MSKKIKSEIIRIDLAEASYKNSSAYIEPTYVNFFFGNNGAGKSTIAKAIKTGAGVTYISGRTFNDYLPLIYDESFIDENFRSYRNMKGVFTLNARNVEIQKKIDEIKEERNKVNDKLRDANEKRNKVETAKGKLHRDFLKECWEHGKTIRDEFPETMSGKGKSEPFVREILSHTPAEIDKVALRRLYDSAYSQSAKHYDRFKAITNPNILDALPGIELLSKAVVNSAETDLAHFLRSLGATEWMRLGHDDYSFSV